MSADKTNNGHGAHRVSWFVCVQQQKLCNTNWKNLTVLYGFALDILFTLTLVRFLSLCHLYYCYLSFQDCAIYFIVIFSLISAVFHILTDIGLANSVQTESLSYDRVTPEVII